MYRIFFLEYKRVCVSRIKGGEGVKSPIRIVLTRVYMQELHTHTAARPSWNKNNLNNYSLLPTQLVLQGRRRSHLRDHYRDRGRRSIENDGVHVFSELPHA